jgi:hypothetical protein
MTRMGMILGTAAYMSPEQAKGRPADKRSDVWAFGCVVFEMLTGKRAFDGEDVSDTLASVLKGEPDWTSLPADTPAGVRMLIQRCTARDRRQSIGDIAVVQFLLSETGAALGPSPGVSADEITHESPSKLALTVSGSVVVTGLLAAVVAWWLWPVSLRPQPVRFTWTLSQRQASFLIARQSIAITGDGTQIVYVAGNQLYKRALADLRHVLRSDHRGHEPRHLARWAIGRVLGGQFHQTHPNRGRRRVDGLSCGRTIWSDVGSERYGFWCLDKGRVALFSERRCATTARDGQFGRAGAWTADPVQWNGTALHGRKG